MSKKFNFRHKEILLGLFGLFALNAQAETLVRADQSFVSTRYNQVSTNAYQYEPIMIEPSRTSAGAFNSSIIFIAEQLDRNLSAEAKSKPVIVATFTDLDDLTQSTKLGRLSSESLGHELQLRGWPVVDVLLTKNLIINPTGQFSLSRDVNLLRSSYPSANMVVGTYSTSPDGVVVNVRIVDIATGVMISSAQTRLVKDRYIASMVDRPVMLPIVNLSK